MSGKKYEYKIISFVAKTINDQIKGEQMLSEAGANGWKWVSTSYNSFGYMIVLMERQR